MLNDWNPKHVKFIEFRKGISRHPVRFVRVKNRAYAIKQTTEHSAAAEIKNLHMLLEKGIHTLIPVGYVVHHFSPIAVNTQTGISYVKDEIAFVITLLEDKALPDSYLYRLNFQEENKRMIWNAAAELLARLHFHNVFWGDASLANMLVKFIKIRDEKGRVRTEIKAILADAETVEITHSLSYAMRKEELNFFFDSMNWLNEDYRLAGLTRDNFSTAADKKYILKKYNYYYRRFQHVMRFQRKTGINMKQYFPYIEDPAVLKSIKKQIEEHKWYLSEKAGFESDFKDAAQNWLQNIYLPILDELGKLNIFEYFPFKTPAGLYLDIMTHKYYLSENEGKDVGIELSITDFISKYGTENFLSVIKNVIKKLTKLFY